MIISDDAAAHAFDLKKYQLEIYRQLIEQAEDRNIDGADLAAAARVIAKCDMNTMVVQADEAAEILELSSRQVRNLIDSAPEWMEPFITVRDSKGGVKNQVWLRAKVEAYHRVRQATKRARERMSGNS